MFEEMDVSVEEIAEEAFDWLIFLNSDEGQQMLAEEMQGITAVDPAVRSPEDLYTRPWAEDFFALLAQNDNLSLLQAYKIVNFERAGDMKVNKARTEAISKYTGKSHLTPLHSRGRGGVSIPEATLEMYRAIFPGKSDRDFEKHYAKRGN